jgi:hypothetical protein
MKTHTEGVVKRLKQLTGYIHDADEHTYLHRLREFCHYCENTLALRCILSQLPQATYDWNTQWHKLDWPLGDQGYAFRWSALKQLADSGSQHAAFNLLHRINSNLQVSQPTFAQEIVAPLSDYLAHTLEVSSAMLYLLWRYKLWVEWFETERLREIYKSGGEAGLDRNLRRFLFESGVDYPFSDPHSPGGRADVVASLETNDPLVLEIKVWNSEKGYKENRLRDGLRQVMKYTDNYGKDVGYVVVFNLDPIPLQLIGETDDVGKPARIERDRTYYFISVNIAEQEKPISQKDKGKLVEGNKVLLGKLDDGL